MATSSYGLALDRVRAVADLRTVLQLPGLEIPERGRALDALCRFETTTLEIGLIVFSIICPIGLYIHSTDR